MKTVPLTQGAEALVDDEDFEWLSQFRWRVLRNKKVTYARRDAGTKTVLMHVEILQRAGQWRPHDLVDHADGNGLNNCRHNIRASSRTSNGLNRTGINDNKVERDLPPGVHRTGSAFRARVQYRGREFAQTGAELAAVVAWRDAVVDILQFAEGPALRFVA